MSVMICPRLLVQLLSHAFQGFGRKSARTWAAVTSRHVKFIIRQFQNHSHGSETVSTGTTMACLANLRKCGLATWSLCQWSTRNSSSRDSFPPTELKGREFTLSSILMRLENMLTTSVTLWNVQEEHSYRAQNSFKCCSYIKFLYNCPYPAMVIITMDHNANLKNLLNEFFFNSLNSHCDPNHHQNLIV